MKRDPIKSKTKRLLDKVNQPAKTKGDIQTSAMETIKNIVFGVLGGGIAGAIAGRASLGIGALVTGIGHYTGSSIAAMLGLGMMTSTVSNKPDRLEAEKPFADKAKSRVNDFSDTIKHKLFISDKTKSKLADMEEQTDISPIDSKELISNAKLSGIDPNIIIDNMEKDLEQAAQFYAESTDLNDQEDFDEFEEVTDDYEDESSSEPTKESDDDLEGFEDDSPIF